MPISFISRILILEFPLSTLDPRPPITLGQETLLGKSVELIQQTLD
jgi:hypothetical protein